uniref:Uncharacterized protein n=1 Tax=Nelumbo nucifera TaxID=4432 RepID=A0A822YHU2_NELNU|nr:TPA_asm: hypothetical protein HUJ06_010873 [Nelumbo nucifera]
MHDIPRRFFSDHNCKLLASAAGKVLPENEIKNGTPTRGKIVRLKLKIDLRKPLFKGLVLSNGSEPIWVRFTYEGLTKLCIYYGLVGHSWKKHRQISLRVSLDQIANELEDREFDSLGDWLRAEFKPNKPLKYPDLCKGYSPCKQLTLVRRDCSSDEDSEEESGAEKKQRLLQGALQQLKHSSKEKAKVQKLYSGEDDKGEPATLKRKWSEPSYSVTRKKDKSVPRDGEGKQCHAINATEAEIWAVI